MFASNMGSEYQHQVDTNSKWTVGTQVIMTNDGCCQDREAQLPNMFDNDKETCYLLTTMQNCHDEETY